MSKALRVIVLCLGLHVGLLAGAACDEHPSLYRAEVSRVTDYATCPKEDASIVIVEADAGQLWCPPCPVCQHEPAPKIDAGVVGVWCTVVSPTGDETCLFHTDYPTETIDSLCEDCLPSGGKCVCYGRDSWDGRLNRPTPPMCPIDYSCTGS